MGKVPTICFAVGCEPVVQIRNRHTTYIPMKRPIGTILLLLLYPMVVSTKTYSALILCMCTKYITTRLQRCHDCGVSTITNGVVNTHGFWCEPNLSACVMSGFGIAS